MVVKQQFSTNIREKYNQETNSTKIKTWFIINNDYIHN